MKTFQELREKSVSQSQQKMMGMALAYKRGEMDDASPEVKKMADSMSMKDLEDFAKTKHKGLPKKVAEGAMSDFHLMVKEKVPAEKIAKELGLDLKTVKKLMKDMKESVELDEAAPKIKGNSGPWSKSDLQKAFKAANVDVAVQARITKALREM